MDIMSDSDLLLSRDNCKVPVQIHDNNSMYLINKIICNVLYRFLNQLISKGLSYEKWSVSTKRNVENLLRESLFKNTKFLGKDFSSVSGYFYQHNYVKNVVKGSS